MSFASVMNVVLPVIYGAVGVALVVVLVKVVQILGNVNSTVTDVRKQLAPTLDNVEKLTTQAQPLMENVNQVVESVDPMMDRVNLTVDAVNLELMRVDGILENVGDITSGLSSATAAADTIANAPLRLVDSASAMLRQAVKPRKASDESVTLGQKKVQSVEAPAPAEDAAPVEEPSVEAKTAVADAFKKAIAEEEE